MREFSTLRAQDILVLLKLSLLQGQEWRQLDVANSLHISPGEVSHSLQRLKASRLIHEDGKSLFRANALEFLLYGVKYVFPAKFGPSELGIPTAHSAPPLNKKIKSRDKIVWPYPEGDTKGEVLYPLYPSVPKAVDGDPNLHELLALLDAIRIGRAREREIATQELEKRLL